MTRVQKGYYIHKKSNGELLGDLQHAWGINDELPTAWQDVQQDPEIAEAHIFSSTQRNRRADKRKILDRFSRQS